MFAPNYIENKLKFFPHIKEAVAFGNERDNGVRVHQHRHGLGRQLGRAPRHSRTPATPISPRSREVYELIRECVEQVNAELARRRVDSPTSQIHRFLILHKELDPDDDELTRTRKVRRSFVAEKYARADRRALRRQDGRSTSRRWCASRTAAPAWSRPDLRIGCEDARRHVPCPRSDASWAASRVKRSCA